MVIGLALAVAAATIMYVTFFRPSPAIPSPTTSPGNHIAKHEITTLRQVVTFAVVGSPDTVQIDPRGKIVVVSSENGQIGAWSTSNSRPIPGFTAISDGASAHSGGAVSPAFSPDGKSFSFIELNGDSEVADVWNVTTGQVISVPLADISSTFTADYAIPGPGELLADSYPNGTLGLTTMTTGAPDTLLTINRSGGVAYRIGEPVFSPDGKTIAIGDNLGMIHLVDVPGKRLSVARRSPVP
jgi:WD40 repeat protein